MRKIELIASLNCCIQNTASTEYKKTLRQLLSADVIDEELEEKAETLRKFLETADFKKLRAESEKFMAEGKEVRFIISFESGGCSYNMLVD